MAFVTPPEQYLDSDGKPRVGVIRMSEVHLYGSKTENDCKGGVSDRFVGGVSLLPFYWNEQLNDWVSFAMLPLPFKGVAGGGALGGAMGPWGHFSAIWDGLAVPSYGYVTAMHGSFFSTGAPNDRPSGASYDVLFAEWARGVTSTISVPIPDRIVGGAAGNYASMAHEFKPPFRCGVYDTFRMQVVDDCALERMPAEPNGVLHFYYRIPSPAELNRIAFGGELPA